MLHTRWNEATARERLLLIVMVLVVCCAVLIAALVRPAWRVVQSAPATLSALETKVLMMRAQAAQLRAAPAVAPAAAPASAERELAGPGASISEVRDAAGTGRATTTVNFKAVDSTRLAAWLAQRKVQERIQRLNLLRDPASGRVTGSVVLRALS